MKRTIAAVLAALMTILCIGGGYSESDALSGGIEAEEIIPEQLPEPEQESEEDMATGDKLVNLDDLKVAYDKQQEDTNSLKSAIISFFKDETKNTIITGWVEGYNLPTYGDTVDFSNPTSSASMRYVVVSCYAGDVFTVNARGARAARAWAFTDTSGNIAKVGTKAIRSGENATAVNRELVAPVNGYLILNDYMENGVFVRYSYTGSVLGSNSHIDRISKEVLAGNLFENTQYEHEVTDKGLTLDNLFYSGVVLDGTLANETTCYISAPYITLDGTKKYTIYCDCDSDNFYYGFSMRGKKTGSSSYSGVQIADGSNLWVREKQQAFVFAPKYSYSECYFTIYQNSGESMEFDSLPVHIYIVEGELNSTDFNNEQPMANNVIYDYNRNYSIKQVIEANDIVLNDYELLFNVVPSGATAQGFATDETYGYICYYMTANTDAHLRKFDMADGSVISDIQMGVDAHVNNITIYGEELYVALAGGSPIVYVYNTNLVLQRTIDTGVPLMGFCRYSTDDATVSGCLALGMETGSGRIATIWIDEAEKHSSFVQKRYLKTVGNASGPRNGFDIKNDAFYTISSYSFERDPERFATSIDMYSVSAIQCRKLYLIDFFEEAEDITITDTGIYLSTVNGNIYFIKVHYGTFKNALNGDFWTKYRINGNWAAAPYAIEQQNHIVSAFKIPVPKSNELYALPIVSPAWMVDGVICDKVAINPTTYDLTISGKTQSDSEIVVYYIVYELGEDYQTYAYKSGKATVIGSSVTNYGDLSISNPFTTDMSISMPITFLPSPGYGMTGETTEIT